MMMTIKPFHEKLGKVKVQVPYTYWAVGSGEMLISLSMAIEPVGG